MLVRKEEGATTLTDIPDDILEKSWKNDNLIGRGGERATVSPILRYRNRSGDEGKGRLRGFSAGIPGKTKFDSESGESSWAGSIRKEEGGAKRIFKDKKKEEKK